jgi:hypothetical protein
MEPKKEASKKGKLAVPPPVNGVEYDLDTPLWKKYYEITRKTIRFPRYYKKDLNW